LPGPSSISQALGFCEIDALENPPDVGPPNARRGITCSVRQHNNILWHVKPPCQDLREFSKRCLMLPQILPAECVAELFRLNLDGTNLQGIKLYNCDFSSTFFRNCRMEGILFYRCALTDARFDNSSLAGAIFLECQLNGATFSKNDLTGVHMLRTTLVGAKMYDTDLSDALFVETSLKETELHRTDASRALIIQ
jgi:hypothetical protein